MADTQNFQMLEVGGKRLAFLMAAAQEYGANLREIFAPLITGVGPVEAAIATERFLSGFSDESSKPDLIINLGSAGSRQLQQAQVYQVTEVSYRDMDASALGFAKGATPFLDQPAILKMPLLIEGVACASLSTGANVVSGSAYDTIDAQMVDMETYAIARACQHHQVPLIGLRGISDGKTELSTITDWTQYLHIIDEKLATATRQLIEQIESGKISI